MNANQNPIPAAAVRRAKRCETCHFMERENGDTFCHRMPPVNSPIIAHTPQGPRVVAAFAAFPPVVVNGWCGEWKQRTEAIMETTASVPRG